MNDSYIFLNKRLGFPSNSPTCEELENYIKFVYNISQSDENLRKDLKLNLQLYLLEFLKLNGQDHPLWRMVNEILKIEDENIFIGIFVRNLPFIYW